MYNQLKNTALLDTHQLNVTMLFHQPVSHTTLNWQRLKRTESKHNLTIYINVTKLRLKVASTTGIPLHILQLHLHALQISNVTDLPPKFVERDFPSIKLTYCALPKSVCVLRVEGLVAAWLRSPWDVTMHWLVKQSCKNLLHGHLDPWREWHHAARICWEPLAQWHSIIQGGSNMPGTVYTQISPGKFEPPCTSKKT